MEVTQDLDILQSAIKRELGHTFFNCGSVDRQPSQSNQELKQNSNIVFCHWRLEGTARRQQGLRSQTSIAFKFAKVLLLLFIIIIILLLLFSYRLFLAQYSFFENFYQYYVDIPIIIFVIIICVSTLMILTLKYGTKLYYNIIFYQLKIKKEKSKNEIF